MKRHQITIEALNDFEHVINIASSSSELKSIKLVTKVKNGDLRSYFIVEKKNNNKEHRVIFNIETMFLDVAVNEYNNL